MQFHACLHQAHHRGRILGVVLGEHGGVGLNRGDFKRLAVLCRQCVPFLLIDHERQLRAAFPPAGIVVVPGDFVEAEFFVVVRPDPFGRVQRAAFQCWVDVAARQGLRHRAEARHDLAAEAGDAHFQPLEVGQRFDLVTEPAAHLRAGIAAGKLHDVVAFEKFAHQFQTAACHHPGVLLARRQAERHGAIEGERHVLANVVIARRVAAFHRAVLHRVEYLQAGYQLAAGEHADVEFAVGQRRHAFGQDFSRTIDGIQTLGEARRQPPFHHRRIRRLRQLRRQRDGTSQARTACALEKIASLHCCHPGLIIDSATKISDSKSWIV